MDQPNKPTPTPPPTGGPTQDSSKPPVPPTKQQPPPKTPQTQESIKKNTNKILKITFVSSVILISLTSAIIFFTNSLSTRLKLAKDQLALEVGSELNVESVAQFLQVNQNQVDSIASALPDEISLVDFVSSVESIAAQHSNSSSLEFSALAPTGSGTDKFIPFLIKIDTDTVNFQEFLKRLEKIPYIVEITTIESSVNQTTPGLWQYIIAARIYVREPFKS